MDAGRIEQLERENAALRRGLRLLHELANLVRDADEPDATAYAVLTGVTAGIGLGLNRAMIYVPSTADRSVLVGAAAIGPADAAEADRVWRAIEAGPRDALRGRSAAARRTLETPDGSLVHLRIAGYEELWFDDLFHRLAYRVVDVRATTCGRT